ncbi:MAG: transglycosylase SLT domain-containing protein [Paludibacteraceae bacterium]|nr:transglycosylase SLT domain-containing protein [Paludibacteraceae bacterium]
MKQLFIYISLFLVTAVNAVEDTTYLDLQIHADSIIALPHDSLTTAIADSVEGSLFFDEALAWLDTVPCTSDSIILQLPDSTYKARLQSLPFVIEVPYNHIVRGFINKYIQNSQRLARLQRKSDYYFPLFEDIICRYDLPYELCYLAVIESALNPQARSRMGAGGLWQFMPSTGKLYGLEINSLVDERLDPVRSTDAACRYLKALYNIFQDWNLAIAAYNCGPGNVNKAIHRSGKRDFWSIYPYLPKETRSYLPLFISAAYAMNFADAHGICPAEVDRTMYTDTVYTHERMHLKQVSDILGISLDELRLLNPQYTHDILPGGDKAYALCLPINKIGQFIDRQDTITSHRSKELLENRRAEIDMLHKQGLNGGYTLNGVTYYKIKNGDTLGGIAKRFHVSVKQLRKWNNLKNDNIRAGKTLRIGG